MRKTSFIAAQMIILMLVIINPIHADVITDWNKTAADYLGDHVGGIQAIRGQVMVHVAQFDAINSVQGGYTPYALHVSAPGASTEAAAAQAAYTVLTNLSRANLTVLNSALARSLAAIAEGQAREDGLSIGRLAADTIVKLRASDNMSLEIRATNSTATGKWRPTPPNNTLGVGAQFRYFLPWTMKSPAEFRPGPPPALNSELYAVDFNEVRLIGARNSTNRTASQAASAMFHHAGIHAFLDPAVTNRTLPLIESARAHALLYMIVMDGEIAFLEAQYAYNFWRPITAIRNAQNDGNDATSPEANWTPLLETPAHPEYPSGTCTFTSGVVTLLTHFYGDDFSFTGTSRNGPKRTFERLSAAVDDAVEARVAAGAHFRNSCLEGVALGRRIAQNAINNFLKPLPRTLTVGQPNAGEIQLFIQPSKPIVYILEASSDLNRWTPLKTNVYGAVLHSDTTANDINKRFYRTQIQP